MGGITTGMFTNVLKCLKISAGNETANRSNVCGELRRIQRQECQQQLLEMSASNFRKCYQPTYFGTHWQSGCTKQDRN
jgi:hypothetical protein